MNGKHLEFLFWMLYDFNMIYVSMVERRAWKIEQTE